MSRAYIIHLDLNELLSKVRFETTLIDSKEEGDGAHSHGATAGAHTSGATAAASSQPSPLLWESTHTTESGKQPAEDRVPLRPALNATKWAVERGAFVHENLGVVKHEGMLQLVATSDIPAGTVIMRIARKICLFGDTALCGGRAADMTDLQASLACWAQTRNGINVNVPLMARILLERSMQHASAWGRYLCASRTAPHKDFAALNNADKVKGLDLVVVYDVTSAV